MNQEKQTGFLEQFFIACTRPSSYGDLLKKKNGARVGYVLLLVAFLVFVESVLPFAAWNASVGGFENFILNRIPEFTVSDGVFKIETPLNIDYSGVFHVKVDSAIDTFNETNLNEDYYDEILIGKRNILLKIGSKTQNVTWKSMGEMSLNNKKMLAVIPAIYMSLCFCLLFLFISKGVQYMFFVLLFAMICRASVRTKDGRFVTMKEAFILAIYARTLSCILSSVNVALGHTVDGLIISIASVLLTINYMYRAERSILQPNLTQES